MIFNRQKKKRRVKLTRLYSFYINLSKTGGSFLPNMIYNDFNHKGKSMGKTINANLLNCQAPLKSKCMRCMIALVIPQA